MMMVIAAVPGVSLPPVLAAHPIYDAPGHCEAECN